MSDERHGIDVTDPRLTLAATIGHFLTYVLASSSTKPAHPDAWAALEELDAIRRALQTASGVEPTPLDDPYGRPIDRLSQTEGDK